MIRAQTKRVTNKQIEIHDLKKWVYPPESKDTQEYVKFNAMKGECIWQPIPEATNHMLGN